MRLPRATRLTLTPDEPDDDRSHRYRPVRLVSTGLAPLAAPPRQPPTSPACLVPCELCGVRVLHGVTASGQRLALDTSLVSYIVDWDHGEQAPRLSPSRGYPVHRCTTV